MNGKRWSWEWMIPRIGLENLKAMNKQETIKEYII
jgi:hypothetical protein